MTEKNSVLPENVDQFRSRLLAWYRRNRRELPWRGESSPYRIWVSEVMLQQTQVATVIPYYERFIQKFPTVEALANASLDEVLKVWEGLGYYSRARNLHKAAAEIVSNYEGRLPEQARELLGLPGFGEYTAGAVASIAFGEPVPAVDGNTKRVLARISAIEDDIQRGPAARRVKEIAAALVDPDHPGDWTQALIELGATVCLPQTPHCSLCPVNSYCEGRRLGIEQKLPYRPEKKALPHYDVTAAVIWKNHYVLIAKRPLDAMLGGLWEFPGGKQGPGETLVECLKREIKEELGVEIKVEQSIVSIQHSYTHFRITLHAFHCRLVRGEPQALGVADWRWVTLKQLKAFPFPRTDLKIIDVLKRQKKPQL